MQQHVFLRGLHSWAEEYIVWRGDFSLEEPEKFSGKLRAITRAGNNHVLLLRVTWVGGQAGAVSCSFSFSCQKPYGERDNSSQTCLMSACMLSVNRAGCVKLETHFQLTSHSPEDAQTGWVLGVWRHTVNYHGNSFLSSQLKHVWYPAPARHGHIIRQI